MHANGTTWLDQIMGLMRPPRGFWANMKRPLTPKRVRGKKCKSHRSYVRAVARRRRRNEIAAQSRRRNRG